MSDTVVKRQHKKSQHVSTKRVGLTGNSISTKMDRSRKPRAVKTMSLLQSASRFFLISVSCMAILAATFLSPWRTVRSLDHKLVVFGRPLSAEYASTEEQDSRSTRFPSVDDRVRIYMGRWYEPPCEDSDKVGFKRITVNETIGRSGQPESFFLVRELPQFDRPKRRRIFVLTNSVQTTRAFYLDRHALKNCSDQNLRNYCRDSRDFILPALERLNANSTTSSGIPTFLQFGDLGSTHSYRSIHLNTTSFNPYFPVIKKFRNAFQGGMDEVRAITGDTCISGPRLTSNAYIIWRLTSKRHFGTLPLVPQVDVPWKDKKNVAIFRGALTGKNRDGFLVGTNATDEEKCLSMHRCKLVFKTHTSPIVNAHLTPPPPKNILPKKVGKVRLSGPKTNLEDMLKYKAIIMLEGNDVSSGLKWALYSNSVVMTQAPPTKSSWLMEETLEPWKHYIPLNRDLSDVEEKMQWVIDHDKESQAIAKQGSLWMKDLLYHPDSKTDEEVIFEEMLRRYQAHFVESDDLSLEILETSK